MTEFSTRRLCRFGLSWAEVLAGCSREPAPRAGLREVAEG